MNECVDIVKHSESPKYSHYTEQQRCSEWKINYILLIVNKLKSFYVTLFILANDAATVPIIVTDNLQRTKDGKNVQFFI